MQPDPRFKEIIKKYKENGKKKNIILTCHGGGSWGAYEIGYMLRMSEISLLSVVNSAVGTSVGALNVSLLGVHIYEDFEPAVKIWSDILKNENIYERQLNIPTIIWQGICKSSSILDPTKGLYKILQTKFGNMKFSECKIPVYVCATKLDKNTYSDGGVGQNLPIKKSLELQPDALINLGCAPDMGNDDILKVYGGNDKIVDGCKSSSAVPVLFPPFMENGEKSKSFIDYGISLINTMQVVMEELDWTLMDQYIKLMEYTKNKKINILNGYPKVSLGHDFLDFSKVNIDIEKGYVDACQYLTAEIVEEFLK
jgi:hypothetical protein